MISSSEIGGDRIPPRGCEGGIQASGIAAYSSVQRRFLVAGWGVDPQIERLRAPSQKLDKDSESMSKHEVSEKFPSAARSSHQWLMS